MAVVAADVVTVDVGGERATVRGAAGTLVRWLADNQRAVNAIRFGSFEFEIGDGRARPRIRIDHERLEIAST